MTCNIYIYSWDLAAATQGAAALGKTLTEAILSYQPEEQPKPEKGKEVEA